MTMQLFITNATKQKFNFTYSLPEKIQPFIRRMLPGAQTSIMGTREEIDFIIKQHEKYGMKPISNIDKEFSGIAYSVQKVIKLDQIEDAMTKRDEVIISRSNDVHEVGAVALDHTIASKAQEMGLSDRGGITVSVKEEKKSPADNNSKMEKNIEVLHEGSPQRGRGRPRK